MYLFMSHAGSTATSSIHTDPPSSEHPPHSGSRAGASMSCGDATCPHDHCWNLWTSPKDRQAAQSPATIVRLTGAGFPAPSEAPSSLASCAGTRKEVCSRVHCRVAEPSSVSPAESVLLASAPKVK